MTPVFCCGFECGQLGAAGQHWFLPLGSPTISTSIVRTGNRSLKVLADNTTGQVAATLASPGTALVLRFYVYFNTLPSADSFIGGVLGGGNNSGAFFKSSDSKIYAGNTAAGTGATGVSVVTGQWYLIDVKIDILNNPWLINVSVNGTACGQLSRAVAGSTITNVRLGLVTVMVSGELYYDDVVASVTLADYPIGGGHVNHFIATSDGTHTSTGTNIVEGTLATPVGTAITSATTDAFNWVNGVPLLGGATDNTRLINQQTASSAQYVEEVFGAAPGIPTPTVAPRAVEVITADREASTALCDFKTKINDNGTEADVANRGNVAGSTSDRYITKQFATAPTGGAWVVTSGNGNFNNLRARFGYSADATPDVYWRGIMVEAEFLPLTYTISPTVGSYSFTGNSVNLVVNRKLSVDAGSYALTGNTVNLKVNRELSVASGSYLLNGNAVNLKVSRNLSVDAGSYLLSGNNVNLLVNRSLVVDAGSYLLTGNDINIIEGRVLVVEAGVYLLNGNNVELIYTPFNPPTPPPQTGDGFRRNEGGRNRKKEDEEKKRIEEENNEWMHYFSAASEILVKEP